MFKIERKAELTDTGATVHKRLVTPWFYIRLKSVMFELESGRYRFQVTLIPLGFFNFIPITLLFKCDSRLATHAGERWVGKGDSFSDYFFLCDVYPKKITKLTALNDPS